MTNSNQTPTNTQRNVNECSTDVHQAFNPNRTVIDVSSPDDKEVVVLPSILLSDIACTLETLREGLEYLSDIFWQIENGQITNAKAVAHLNIYSTLYLSNHADGELQQLAKVLVDSNYPVSKEV